MKHHIAQADQVKSFALCKKLYQILNYSFTETCEVRIRAGRCWIRLVLPLWPMKPCPETTGYAQMLCVGSGQIQLILLSWAGVTTARLCFKLSFYHFEWLFSSGCICCIGDNWVFVICTFLVSAAETGGCFGEEVQFEEPVKGERKEMFLLHFIIRRLWWRKQALERSGCISSRSLGVFGYLSYMKTMRISYPS